MDIWFLSIPIQTLPGFPGSPNVQNMFFGRHLLCYLTDSVAKAAHLTFSGIDYIDPMFTLHKSVHLEVNSSFSIYLSICTHNARFVPLKLLYYFNMHSLYHLCYFIIFRFVYMKNRNVLSWLIISCVFLSLWCNVPILKSTLCLTLLLHYICRAH